MAITYKITISGSADNYPVPHELSLIIEDILKGQPNIEGSVTLVVTDKPPIEEITEPEPEPEP